MNDPQHPNRAIAMLAHLAPRDVLMQARDLARELQHEEYISQYIEEYGGRLTLAGVALGIFSFILIATGIARLTHFLRPVSPFTSKLLLLLGCALWLAVMALAIYLALAALARRAEAKLSQSPDNEPQ